jgi:hypothetical protein
MKPIHIFYLSFFSTIALLTSSICSGGQARLSSNKDMTVLCQDYVTKSNINTKDLNPDDPFAMGICQGYIIGFNYTARSYSGNIVKHGSSKRQSEFIKKTFYCMPSNTNIHDMAAVYVNYMNQHPDQINGDVNTSMLNAFVEAYPCPQ